MRFETPTAMRQHIRQSFPSVLALSTSLLIAAATGSCSNKFDPNSYAPADVISTDVAIIGGGATGTYAAVTLSRMGKKVALVEMDNQLGGHVNTYVDPATGTIVDYGVVRYGNEPVATDFFDFLGVNYTSTFEPGSTKTRVYADFAKAKTLDFSPGTNYTAYIQQLEKYPYLVWTSNIPSPAPADLSLSMRDFIQMYNLQDIAYEMYYHMGGSFLDLPLLSVASEFGLAELVADNSAGSTLRVVGGNHQTYAKALDYLGPSVLLNTLVTDAQRTTAESKLVVKTPSGKKLIVAKRVLVTIPTIKSNMEPLSPDSKENDVFSKFSARGYWTGLVKISGLPAGTAYSNAGTNTEYHIPKAPSVAFLNPTAIAGVYQYWYFDDKVISNSDAKKKSLAAIEKFVKGLLDAKDVSDPTLVAFSSHSPWKATLSADAIREDYWAKTYALQGYRNTWYTGAQFLIGSTQLWNYTQSLIPDIVAGL